MERTDALLRGQARALPRRLAAVWAAAILVLATVAGARAQALQIPRPTGYVNDFAGIIDAQSEARIQQVVEEVRQKSGGEIAVVTLPSLQGRSISEVSLQILREWGVGARSRGVGDSIANTGTVILVAPNERRVRIEVGYGANTFITAAEAGRIQDEVMLPAFRQNQYGPGILAGTAAVAQQYARRFNFQLTGDVPVAQPREPPQQQPGRRGGIPSGFVIILLIFFFLMFRGRGGGGGGGGRRRRGYRGPIILPFPIGGGWGGGGGFGGGGWGGGGFGGGGFGGFGGGGGGGGGADRGW